MSTSGIAQRGGATRFTDSDTTRSIGVGALIGLAVALTGNTIVFRIGNLGSPIRVVTGWAPEGADLTFTELVVTTIVAVAAGSGLLWLMTRRHPHRARTWVGIAAAVAVTSAIPLWRLDIDTGSSASLTAMHLWTGFATILGHHIANRR